jgi:hypothetical protein
MIMNIKLVLSGYLTRKRLGVSEFLEILYDLSEIIQVVLKDITSDHVLGPDGFNRPFFQKKLAYHRRGCH